MSQCCPICKRVHSSTACHSALDELTEMSQKIGGYSLEVPYEDWPPPQLISSVKKLMREGVSYDFYANCDVDDDSAKQIITLVTNYNRSAT